jgi:hypothetical protein
MSMEDRIKQRIAELIKAKTEVERHLRDISVALGECESLLAPEKSEMTGAPLGEQTP